MSPLDVVSDISVRSDIGGMKREDIILLFGASAKLLRRTIP